MKKHLWFPDEVARAGGEHLDPSYVDGYDRKAGVDPTEDVAALRGLGMDETHTLVDFGAGTGAFALAAAPFCRSVVAVDVSDAMLSRLEEKAEEKGVENIECAHGGFLSYEHRGDEADFVYSRHALHHLPDFWKAIALEKISGILETGGVFHLRDIIFSFDAREAENVIERWLEGSAERPEDGWTRSEVEKDIREEHITFDWLLEPMIERAGFGIQDANHDASRVFSAHTCVKTR